MKLYNPQKTGLIILDGWGVGLPDKYNAINLAKTPTYDNLQKKYPNSLLTTFGIEVGLPIGQMGNSEVGHSNIGAGRILKQDILKIDEAIADKTYFNNLHLVELFQHLKTSQQTLHIFNLISDGGVHSSMSHLLATVKFLTDNKIKTALHLFTDGRDVGPQSAVKYFDELKLILGKSSSVRIASISGRFFAMDRDNRWERIQKAYLAIIGASQNKFKSSHEAIKNSYAFKINDEFIEPSCIFDKAGLTTQISDNDAILFLNFRSDRARQLSEVFLNPEFDEFKVESKKLFGFYTLTQFNEKFSDFGVKVLFEKDKVINSYGEWIAKHGLKQLRIAETEKYPHVTFFFNQGLEAPFKDEDRILIPSPKVKTYDLQPEMSLPAVTKSLVQAIKTDKYHTFICNIANADMVGHSGNIKACVETCEAVDAALKQITQAMQENAYQALIIADHGNVETLFNPLTNQPHTSHTTNMVPMIYFGEQDIQLKNGNLSGIAPSLLDLLQIPKPIEMTGESLILRQR